jgi:hypothetical protein
MAQGKQLGGSQTLSVVEIAVGVFAVVCQMVPVAKIHAAHLPPLLQRLDCINVGFP